MAISIDERLRKYEAEKQRILTQPLSAQERDEYIRELAKRLKI